MNIAKRAISLFLTAAILLPSILMMNQVEVVRANDIKENMTIRSFETVKGIELEEKGTLEEVLNRLPEKIKVTLSDQSEKNIRAKWKCMDDYENTDFDIYTFTLILPKEYSLAKNVDLPYIDVSIKGERGVDGRVQFPENSGGTLTIDKKFECTKDIASYLQDKYDKDRNYYIGTPYYEKVFEEPYTDWLLANGATPDKKSGHMNCTGFVADVIRKCGGNLRLCTNRRTGWYINASNWHDFANGYTKQPNGSWAQDMSKACKSYKFNSIDEALKSGVMEKGDILYFEPLDWSAPGADCHIGFFWGNTPSENLFWHSATKPSRGNQVSAITPKVPSTLYVYKITHTPQTGGLSIQKVSGDSALTNGNPYYSLKNAEYGIYSDQACSKLVTTIKTTTDDGYAATSDTALKIGTYYVKEIKPSLGYELDKNVYPYQIKGGEKASANKQTSKEPPKKAKISLKKASGNTDATSGNENYSLKGAEYTVYKDQKCTKAIGVIKTDETGYAFSIKRNFD